MTITTETGLLRAICENPADDCLRLVYADWLDDCGEAERAEFIRVQCELAKECACVCGPTRGGWRTCHSCVLHRRERDLLDKRDLHWLDEAFGGIPWCGKSESGDSRLMPFGPDGDSRIEVKFRRGFIDEVRCTMADWCGTECAACDGTGKRSHSLVSGGLISTDCDKCFSIGRIGAHGPAIVAAQPVTRVVLTDAIHPREYGGGDDRWAVYRDQLGPLWDVLVPGEATAVYWFAERRDHDELESTLSLAAVSWARSAAGLPPLSPAAAG